MKAVSRHSKISEVAILAAKQEGAEITVCKPPKDALLLQIMILISEKTIEHHYQVPSPVYRTVHYCS